MKKHLCSLLPLVFFVVYQVAVASAAPICLVTFHPKDNERVLGNVELVKGPRGLEEEECCLSLLFPSCCGCGWHSLWRWHHLWH
jgi:hypothetical protein